MCDPNAAWLKKEKQDEGTVRIFSTTMLKRMGVIFRMEEYNDLDMMVCNRSGNMIETKISHGIVVIDTTPSLMLGSSAKMSLLTISFSRFR